MILDTFRKLYELLDRRERQKTLLILVIMGFVAIFEAMGAVSIMPFMAVLANQDVIHTNTLLSSLYRDFSFQSADSFLLFLGCLFLALIVGSLAFRAMAYWIQVRFSFMRSHAWSCRLVQTYLNRPYEWFLHKHSGGLGSSVLQEVNRVVFQSLFPAIQLVAQSLVAGLLMILMLLVDPLLAISTAIVLGGAYLAIFLIFRRYLEQLGLNVLQADRQRFRISQEMFGGIKDVKVLGLEQSFLDRYRGPSLLAAQRLVSNKVVSELPSFAMQALVFGGVMAVLLYFIGSKGGLDTALPVFAFYALAGYRLMPALQAIYRHLAEIRGNTATLDHVHGECVPSRGVDPNRLDKRDDRAATVSRHFSLESVSYKYPGAEDWALRKLSITIPALATVGIVGSSGAGKTTLVDVILGLLVPQEGRLSIDGVSVDTTNYSLQRLIGYVPQQIFLSDESVRENIAFGVPPNEIDDRSVERASRVANLHDFVVSELRDGYSTIVGERGVRLSGGQRQRIGIARALYRDPPILLLDEATSALDNITEQAVMEAVRSLNRRKTIVLIAHRLSTIRECDIIFYVEKGQIMASGTYSELLRNSASFRGLVGGSDSAH